MKILNGKYTLRPFAPEDENGVLELWKIAFKATISLELFRWKYLENPYTQTMMLCVTDKDEIVTFYGGIPYFFQYEKKIVPVVNLMDIMSHPMHRENRIFEKTAKQFMAYFCYPAKRHGPASLQDNLLLMYGFPGEFHYSIGERILNYRKANQVAYMKLSLSNLAESEQPANIKGLNLNELNLEAWESDPIWFDRLWDRCKKNYPFSIVRDSKFIKWRFINHPEKRYTILKFTNDNNESEAFVVLQINEDKAAIVDMLIPNDIELFKNVISRIIDYLDFINISSNTNKSMNIDNNINMNENIKYKIQYIETWLPENHFLTDHALNCGFLRQKEPIGIIPTVSLFEHSPTLEWVTSNLYYNMGDGDLL
ncbi:MAG: GNAT family N-acetyltransferase [Desulfamplus sp.]|nr:GNAT family N-acetyltransferase [Desulfamplus sp.]